MPKKQTRQNGFWAELKPVKQTSSLKPSHGRIRLSNQQQTSEDFQSEENQMD